MLDAPSTQPHGPSIEALRSPLTLYVVFHPRSDTCWRLADYLHSWFRLRASDGVDNQAGLPVWFRAAIARDAGPWRLRPELKLKDADLNVVVILIDDVMVSDPAWWEAIAGLSERAKEANTLLLPAPVDASAFRFRFLFDQRNRLDVGRPFPKGVSASESAHESRLFERARILRRSVTEIVARKLHRTGPQTPAGKEPPRLQVFLSHAKRDGRDVAVALRHGLGDFGQLDVWFDEHELPAGYEWEFPMKKAAKDNTAALISVVSDAYPSRPWCRREVNLARYPRKLQSPAGTAGPHVSLWTVQPTVAVVVGGALWSRPMAQLAQVPHMSWPSKTGSADFDRDVHRCIADVVDRLLLEILLTEFYRQMVRKIARSYASSGPLALLTWVPDPWSLVHLRQALNERPVSGAWRVAYPGHGLNHVERLELRSLTDALGEGPSATRPSPIQLVVQERLFEQEHRPKGGMKVALSGGGTNLDVASSGLGLVHVSDIMVRVTRRLIENGARVVYGGALNFRHPNNTLTADLLEVPKAWDASRDERDEFGNPPGGQPTTVAVADHLEALRRAPLTNYSPWPYYDLISQRERAELAGLCEVINVDPYAGIGPGVETKNADVRRNPHHARLAADALSRMRSLSSQECSARIVLAGKVRGWLGWIPGIVEEVAYSLEQGKLPLILGGFGGCAGELAAFLRQENAPWPDSLSIDVARQTDRKTFGLVTESDGGRFAVQKFAWAQRVFTEYRDCLNDPGRWDAHGELLPLVRSLLTETNATKVINTILHVLSLEFETWPGAAGTSPSV